jgi:hypothetical protein
MSKEPEETAANAQAFDNAAFLGNTKGSDKGGR